MDEHEGQRPETEAYIYRCGKEVGPAFFSGYT